MKERKLVRIIFEMLSYLNVAQSLFSAIDLKQLYAYEIKKNIVK